MENRGGAKKKAVVLLSGGLDSATVLYWAKEKGFKCLCLAFDYGQRHRREIRAARDISRAAGCAFTAVRIALPWKGSALLDKKTLVPEYARPQKGTGAQQIPSTYVPARNIIFLSFALSYAEAVGASAIFIGAHTQDYSGYPDCRPEFYRAFVRAAKLGTKAGLEKKGIAVKTPLVRKGKAEIIRMGKRLGVPFALTWSCYRGGKTPCGRCDSCHFRREGFQKAGFDDPAAGHER